MARTFGPYGQIVVESGSGFECKFSSGHLVLASGASGALITLTPPAGQRAKLVRLAAVAGPETGITINIGATEVINSLNLEDNGFIPAASGSGTFKIGTDSGDSSQYLMGKPDEVIEIIKDTGSTGTQLIYAYEFGI